MDWQNDTKRYHESQARCKALVLLDLDRELPGLKYDSEKKASSMWLKQELGA